MTNGAQATVTVNAGQTATATLSLSGDPRFCHISDLFFFDTASSFIDTSIPGHKLAFREVLDRLRQAPPGELLLVVGHTDEVGSSASNDPLSQRRADSVLAVLRGEVDVWENNYQTERSRAWGNNNFRTMLREVTGTNPTQAEINQHKEISPAGEQRRATLFTQYFDVLLGNPNQSININTLVPATLGCGERHILGSGDHQPSRRAEIFFFRGNVSPLVTCDEYPNWLTPCQILPPTTPTVTIASVTAIRQGQVERIQVTVNPSPLPLAVTVTLELSTTSGTGEAQFMSTNAATMEITQSEAVRVRAITQSSTVDNIRMTARVTGQNNILAQEDFTIVSASPAPVNPTITPASPVVVVKKPHTNPARQAITLRTDALFTRSGTLTRSGNTSAVRLFTAAAGGTEITFNGIDNVFSGAQLTAGVQLFAEAGPNPSGTLNDYTLTLTLAPGTVPPIGPAASVSITAVELTLDIFGSRPAPGVDPPPLPQPPATPPPAGTIANDKWFGGRLVSAQDAGNTQERAMIVVRQVQPANFAGALVLRQVAISGNNVTTLDNKVQLFDNETPTAGETAKSNPHEFNASTVQATGLRFFAEGRNASTNARDTGFQLGIKDLEDDGDRVAITVGVGVTITMASPIVVVKKPHTSPARRAITLRTTAPFNRSGTLTRSGNTGAIRLFTAAAGGTEITFNGTDNEFMGAQLTAGVQVFAEGANHSNALNDFQLMLTLTPGASPPAGLPATATMTAVELTLDIAERRINPSVDPPLLSQSDKVNVGRFILAQDATFSRQRAIIIVRPPNPLIPDELVITPINTQVELFGSEDPRSPSPPQTPITMPHTIPSGSIPAIGTRLFVEGKTASSAFRDTGYQLGIAGVATDGDRVAITVLGGDPSQPGLFNVGEHEYTEADEGTFDLPRPGAPGVADDPSVVDPPPAGTPTFTIRRRAVVRYPADSNGSDVPVSAEQTSYPLVVILHGNHRRFLDDGTTFVESYRGLEYLARHLASHGYIALSIDVDDINQRADGIFHRGAAILEHIRIMANRDTSGPPAPGKVDFTGKVDLSHIGLVGHSRGGEGVVAAQNINVTKSLGHQIKGIVSIAPTNFTDLVHNTSPYLVIAGSSDGDVSGDSPFILYDRAAPPKAMIFVYAAMHNRFSTNADWLDPRFIDNDDARIISEADHQNSAKGYVTAFFESDFRGRIGFETFFKNYEKLASVSHVELHQQVQDPTRLVLDNYEQPAPDTTRPLLEQLADRAPTNTLSKAVSGTGLVTPSASLFGLFTNALTETLLSGAFVQFFVHDGAGAMVAWDSSGGVYETTLDGLDVSTFAVLTFRVTQRLGSSRNPSGAAQDFSVRLTDTASQSADVRVGTVTSIPFPFERHDHASVHGPLPPSPTRFVDILPDGPALNKSALKTIRLSLDSFTAVNASLNLGSLQKLEFVFDQTGSGEIAVDDIEFSN